MLISRDAVRGYMERDFDDFTWMKKLTREQILFHIGELQVKPTFKTEPWLHQLVCFYIGLCYPEFLFLLDMGLGKTKIILDLITQAQRENKLRHALVGVPRRINLDSWHDDIIKHSDLEPWLISATDIEQKWEQLLEPTGDITIIDYQSLHLALGEKKPIGKTKKTQLKPDEKKVAKVQKLYNFVVLDESHKLSNPDSLWFRLMRRITSTADYVYAMTGTLFGKRVEDVWPQFYLVDGGETFGENLGLFRKTFFTAEANKWGRGEKFIYQPTMDRKLHTMLRHRSIVYDENEVHDLPARVSRVERFTMGEEQREHYMRALDGLIAAGGVIEEMEGQWLQMRRIVSGYLKWKDDHGSHVMHFKENPKLDGLERLIDEVGGRTKVVVCYDYTETGRMICQRIEQMKLGYEWYYGGTKDKSASRRRFMEDPNCRVFVMNSEAGGTGNDGLQKVASYMFLYETPTPPTTRKQTIKRIHRPGQTQRTFIYDLVMKRSLDVGILEDIKNDLDTYASVVNGRRRPGRNFFLME